MGGLFSSSNKVPTKAIINFEDPAANESPTDPGQKQVHEQLGQLLAQGNGFIDALANFNSAKDLQKRAMQSPKDAALQSEAFQAVLPNVQFTSDVHQFAAALEGVMPTMVDLCRLLAQPAAADAAWVGSSLPIVKRLTDILDLCLRFDLVKMRCPDLLNDFAYYRRNLAKFPDQAVVSEQMTTQISMFMAAANPMLTRLCSAIGSAQDIKKILGNLANICCSMVMGSHCAIGDETTQYSLRVMTVAIVLYDHVVPLGVFRKASIVEMKKCIVQIRDKSDSAADLLNVVRYSTKNYGSADTPTSLNRLLEEACQAATSSAAATGSSESKQ